MSRIGSWVRGLVGAKTTRFDAYKAGIEQTKKWKTETGQDWDGFLDCYGDVDEFVKEASCDEAKDHPAAFRRGVLAGFGQAKPQRR